MKKILMIAAASAALMTGCSQSSEVIDNYDNNAAKVTEETPVTFGTYLSSAVTRAGQTGDITVDALKATKESDNKGFGIFAYYTDNSQYNLSSTEGSTPNFMYNQLVWTSDGTNWQYSPIKYWPNETSTTNADNNGATSEGVDRLTFFAYAPYVASASGSTGITGMSGNSTKGDPKIAYAVSSDPSNSVDLLWGVNGDVSKWLNVADTTALTIGKPYIDMIKPALAQNVKFTFKHALAKLNFTVQGIFDDASKTTNTIDNNTKITVEKVEISSTGFADKGELNLNNSEANKPKWEDVSEAGTISLTASGDNLNDNIKYNGTNSNATVTNETQNLFKLKEGSTDSDYAFMVIPNSKKDLKITITYYTTTTDAKLAGGKSEVKNVITKTISSLTLDAGKSYTFNLALGMESVKVSAEVEQWTNQDSQKVDLPINVD